MNYPDGSPIRTGDIVLWKERQSIGCVMDIFTSPAELERWGLDEPGVMISGFLPLAKEGNLYFLPMWSHEREQLAKLTGELEIRRELATRIAESRFTTDDFQSMAHTIDLIWDEDSEFPVLWTFGVFELAPGNLHQELEQIAISSGDLESIS